MIFDLKSVLICLLPLSFGMAVANARPVRCDTLEMKIYFRQGESRVDPAFRENALRLAAFQAELETLLSDSTAVVRYISVRSAASPEGRTDRNRKLSEARARSIEGFLRRTLPVDPLLFRYQAVGEDWDGLAAAVRALDLPWRDEALDIIENTPAWITRGGRVVDGRKRQLMQLQSGKVWRWLEREVFPELRAAGGSVRCVVFHTVREIPASPDTVYVGRAVPAGSSLGRPRPAPEPLRNAARPESGLSGRKMLFALRTNVLAVPLANLGLEIPLGGRWSLGADYFYPWLWRTGHRGGLDHSGSCSELLAFDLEVRYWFPSRREKPRQRLLGHSLGLYAAAGYYDFERDWTGHQGEFVNVGADYLYAVPVFQDRMHLEFGLGFGYIYSPSQPYDTFERGGMAFRRKGVTHYTRWFGPTRAQISLTVPIYAAKRGGAR
ncbi:MAG: DUF3575 domain-containing protein [Bacteroidales bacterium]|nr:DUF3575 domain-containing protein [Bacteroidales bacterium]